MDWKKLLYVAFFAGALLSVAGGAEIRINEYKKQLVSMSQMLAGVAAERDRLKNTPLPACPPAQTPPTIGENPQNPVSEVFDPEVKDAGAKAKIDDLKKRYEEIFVTYFVLKNCNHATTTDFHILTSALAQEMASMNAPGRLQYDILTSAQGSYRELYSANKCDANDTLEKQFRAFVDGVAEKFTPR